MAETLEYRGPKLANQEGDSRGSKQIIMHNNDRLREVNNRVQFLLDQARGSFPSDPGKAEPHQPHLRDQVRNQQDLITGIESGLDELCKTLFNED